MILPEQIKTIKSFKESLHKEKSSVFKGQVYHIEGENEAEEILKNIRKKFYDASHHCYAYKLYNGITKSSDAGEPSGTAGIRILNAIEHFDLCNLLIVVIRYFGGKKLGVGPLGKAYYTTAYQAIEKAKIIDLKLYLLVKVVSDFEFINQIHKILDSTESTIQSSDFGNNVKFECYIKPSKLDEIRGFLREAGKGKITFTETEKMIYF